MLIVHFKRTLERIHYTIKVIEIFLNLICMFFTFFLISSFLLIYDIIIEGQGKNGYFISNN
jgi:hypothetical protein